MTNVPNYPEVDISLLSGSGDFTQYSPGYPEIDIALLPGVTGQRGPTGPTGPSGTSGATGPTGPTGPGVTNEQITTLIPGLVSYRHTQIAASNTWTITHNLHFMPNVTAFDSSGNMVEGNIVHTTVNSLTIQFSAAISGNAVLS
jgi:hypothetical protein